MSGDQHKFHPCHQLYLSKKLRQNDIPPRKLLSRRSAALDISADEETLLQKYLPYNNPQDEYDSDPYSADQFRMYEFKVRRCTRSRSHDWTDCPFAHPGEKARRRDPRRYHYSGIVCPEFRRGECPRGDNCEFAHGIFECWLHPARYRTEACKDGRSCQRKVCFFAHTPRQLRISPFHSNELGNSSSEDNHRHGGHQCCTHCQCSVLSPNSTLVSMPDSSPPLSPSISPVKSLQNLGGFSPSSRFNDRSGLAELAELKKKYGPAYKNELIKIMNSIQSLNLNKKNSASASGNNKKKLWVDVFDLNPNDQHQFFMSPPSAFESGQSPSDPSSFGYKNIDFSDENGAAEAPDLGWVNELLICDE